MVRTFGGSTPEVVSAQAKLRDPEVDRAMTAELQFAGGHTGRVHCSMWSIASAALHRQGGRRPWRAAAASGDLQLFQRFSVRSADGKRVEHFPRHSSYAYQLDAFAAAVLRGEPVKTTPEEAVENMTVIDAIYRAAGLSLREPA